MHPLQDLFFWKVFHKYYNFTCAPICTKVLFLQKVGVTIRTLVVSLGGKLTFVLIYATMELHQ
jgi:hypothetical protein